MKMKKTTGIFFLVLMLTVVTINVKAAAVYSEEKLHTGWFNPLGGLDNIMTGSAVLTIDQYGGITIKDNFNVFADYIGEHWVTVDRIFRDKSWKNRVSIYATFHHINKLDSKEYKYQGNGSFDFPALGVAHIVSGGAPNIEIVDLYAPMHLSDQNTTEGDGDQQNNGHDPCSIDSRLSKSETVNQTFLEFKRGSVYIKPVGCNVWIKAVNKIKLRSGDVIKTGKNGKASIVLQGSSFVKLIPNSQLRIKYDPELEPKKISFLELAHGVLWAHAKKEKNSLKVATPHAICGVRGTEFEISYVRHVSCVHALRHSVWFSDRQKRKTVIVHEGEKSCIGRDGLPSSSVLAANSTENSQLYTDINEPIGADSESWSEVNAHQLDIDLYKNEKCEAHYSYKGWQFSQTAHMYKITKPGNTYDCAIAVGWDNKKYYDWIKDLSVYKKNNILIAVWFYRRAISGKIDSEHYYYRCLEKNGKLIKNSKIHQISEPKRINTESITCHEENDILPVDNTTCFIEEINKKPEKILQKNGWVLKVWITAKGTRSEGKLSRLYHHGKEIFPQNENKQISTPIGDFIYQNPQYLMGMARLEAKRFNHIYDEPIGFLKVYLLIKLYSFKAC
jgi:hypothetical protein